MVDVKQAVKAAEDYARDLYGEKELRDLRLEEVELGDGGARWRVTLGWAEHSVSPGGLVFTNGKLPRVYKVFEVDAGSGEVKSMKIRDVE
jgi:hypothetical protein